MKGRKNDRNVYGREENVFASPSCSKIEKDEAELEVKIKGKAERCVDELPL